MSAEVIKEFLVSLGYRVNQAEQVKFTGGVIGATKAVGQLALAAKGAATAVVAAMRVISRSMEDLWYASQRTGATVAQINALGFAASQMGTTAEDARGSLEGLAQRLRTNPGYAPFIRQLLGSNADMSNAASVMDQLAVRFRQMPYYMANAYAQALGISEPTLRAMIAGMDTFNADYRRRLRVFGVESERGALVARNFMREFRTMTSNFELMGQRLATALGPAVIRVLQSLNKFMEDNGETIHRVFLFVAELALIASEAVTRAARAIGDAFKGIYDWFRQASPATREVIAAFVALGAAWLAFNGIIAASPIGRLLMLGTALLLLWEDYEKWKSSGGADSLFNWSEWEPTIQQALGYFREVRDWLSTNERGVQMLQVAFGALLVYMTTTWVAGMIGAIGRVAAAIGAGGAVAGGAATGLLGRLATVTGVGAFLLAMRPGGTNNDPQTVQTEAEMNEASRRRLQRDVDEGGPSLEEQAAAARENMARREHEERMERGQRGMLDGLLGFFRQTFGMEPANAATPGGGASGAPVTVPGQETPMPQGSEEHRARSQRLGQRLMRDFGLLPHQAGAIVGHLDHESGLAAINERNPLIPGSRGGFGYAQWTGPRRVAFEQWAAQNGLSPTSEEANYGFLAQELRTHGQGALNAVRATGNSGDAARAFYPFLSGGDSRAIPAWGSRLGRASRATNLLGTGGEGGGTTLGGAPSGGGAPVLNQTTTIVVQGNADPNATAVAVAGQQDRVNADITRNMQGAVR